jgi:hypothetical protein
VVNCVELQEQVEGPGQEEQFSGKTEEMLVSQGCEIMKKCGLLPEPWDRKATFTAYHTPGVWGFAEEQESCLRPKTAWER